ncbi:Protein kinase-like domain [Ceraceosorus bombacis]|uniref:Protein kinase-like domain n=1 Tax=Ceraceosorus bombacis TaxID=401625 RepID=A0A0P1BNJ2_9BASI|nr:Protein kinase-like domain [Ceraceosorus bombacis]
MQDVLTQLRNVVAVEKGEESALTKQISVLLNAYASQLRVFRTNRAPPTRTALTGQTLDFDPITPRDQQTKTITSNGEDNMPDIVLIADAMASVCVDLTDSQTDVGDGTFRPSASVQHPWLQYAAVVEVKRHERDDLNESTVGQMLRYARQLLIAHPFARYVHVVSWTGSKVRIWQFGANGIVFSRAVDAAAAALQDQTSLDHLGRLLHLLMSGESTLLPRWTPKCDGAHALLAQQVAQEQATARAAGIANNGLNQDHVNLITSDALRVVYVRPSLHGSRTVVFGVPLHDHDGEHIFLKCCWLSEHLAHHERNMLDKLGDVSGAPRALASFDLGWTTPSGEPVCGADGRADKAKLSAYVLVFTQHRGCQIPLTASLSDKAAVLQQLVHRLHDYAQKGLHYRDLNTGNVLMRPGTKAEPLLVLVDHGNVREGGNPRRGVQVRETSPGDNTRAHDDQLVAIIQDDARSINQLFVPSGMQMAETQLSIYRTSLESFRKDKQLAASATFGKAIYDKRVLKSEARWRSAHKDAYTRLHRYCDDVESLIYILVWISTRASKLKDLYKHLTNQTRKSLTWEDADQFRQVSAQISGGPLLSLRILRISQFIEHYLDGASQLDLLALQLLHECVLRTQKQVCQMMARHYETAILQGRNDLRFEDLNLRVADAKEPPISDEEVTCMSGCARELLGVLLLTDPTDQERTLSEISDRYSAQEGGTGNAADRQGVS